MGGERQAERISDSAQLIAQTNYSWISFELFVDSRLRGYEKKGIRERQGKVANINEEAHKREILAICEGYLGEAVWRHGEKALFLCRYCKGQGFGVDVEEGKAGCNGERCEARGWMSAVELVALFEGLDSKRDLRKVLQAKRRALGVGRPHRSGATSGGDAGRDARRRAPTGGSGRRPGKTRASPSGGQAEEPERLSVDSALSAQGKMAGRRLSRPEMEQLCRSEITRLGKDADEGLTREELHRALGDLRDTERRFRELAERSRREGDRRRSRRRRDIGAALLSTAAGVLIFLATWAWRGVLEDEARRSDPLSALGLARTEHFLEDWQAFLVAFAGACLAGFVLWTGVTDRPKIRGRVFIAMAALIAAAFFVPWVFIEVFGPLLPEGWGLRQLWISTVPAASMTALALAVAALRSLLRYRDWPDTRPKVSVAETERQLRRRRGSPTETNAGADAPRGGAGGDLGA